MTKQFKLSEVKPRIFFLDFKHQYDCNMFFLRYQEFYESPSSKFRGKSFEIFDFMRWYSLKYGRGAFTYPVDWGGFNIPGDVVFDMWNQHLIPDKNENDFAMKNVWNECYAQYPDRRFYLIGAVGKGGALKHEIAHGFFYTQPLYRDKMTKLVVELKDGFRKSIYKTLKKIGYTPKVYVDECQAYLSTGLTETFDVKLKGEHKPFVKLYKEFYNA